MDCFDFVQQGLERFSTYQAHTKNNDVHILIIETRISPIISAPTPTDPMKWMVKKKKVVTPTRYTKTIFIPCFSLFPRSAFKNVTSAHANGLEIKHPTNTNNTNVQTTH